MMIVPFWEQVLYPNSFRQLGGRSKNNQLKIISWKTYFGMAHSAPLQPFHLGCYSESTLPSGPHLQRVEVLTESKGKNGMRGQPCTGAGRLWAPLVLCTWKGWSYSEIRQPCVCGGAGGEGLQLEKPALDFCFISRRSVWFSYIFRLWFILYFLGDMVEIFGPSITQNRKLHFTGFYCLWFTFAPAALLSQMSASEQVESLAVILRYLLKVCHWPNPEQRKKKRKEKKKRPSPHL